MSLGDAKSESVARSDCLCFGTVGFMASFFLVLDDDLLDDDLVKVGGGEDKFWVDCLEEGLDDGLVGFVVVTAAALVVVDGRGPNIGNGDDLVMADSLVSLSCLTSWSINLELLVCLDCCCVRVCGGAAVALYVLDLDTSLPSFLTMLRISSSRLIAFFLLDC